MNGSDETNQARNFYRREVRSSREWGRPTVLYSISLPSCALARGQETRRIPEGTCHYEYTIHHESRPALRRVRRQMLTGSGHPVFAKHFLSAPRSTVSTIHRGVVTSNVHNRRLCQRVISGDFKRSYGMNVSFLLHRLPTFHTHRHYVQMKASNVQCENREAPGSCTFQCKADGI